ncbi:MAG: hypothetical protein PVG39_11115 [Desulfobacteraceae bacterium]|jgi:hypothetical protein
MFFLHGYKKNGLPYGLVRIHQFLLRDIISYFEKGDSTKKRMKEIRKSIKQAVKFAKKKNVYPSLKTNQAVELMEEMYDELEVTQKVIKEAAAEMDKLIEEIKEERVLNVHSIVTDAQDYFKEKRIDTGITLLQKAQHEIKEKLLLKTRKKILAGLSSEVKKIKYEIEKKEPSLAKHTKFLSMSIPYEDYSSYKLAKNVCNKFSELVN